MSPVRIREEQVHNPGSFVMRVIGTDKRPCVGFKLFYHHCRERYRKALWDLLEHDDAWHIVHLTRNSILDMYVSLLKARMTGEWSRRVSSRAIDRHYVGSGDISLSPEKCITFLETYEREKNQVRALIRGHKSIEVNYEALSQDPKDAVNRTLHFLGQSPLDNCYLSYNKQATRPPAETIKNYRQLQKSLKGTKWAYLVE